MKAETELKVGLIGAGVFGRFHADKIYASDVTFCGVFDLDAACARTLAKAYETSFLPSADAVFDAADAVIIASPASTHYTLAKAALETGCHVLVEKPLSLEVAHAAELARLAEMTGRVLQVGHQERVVCEKIGLFDVRERPKMVEIVRKGPMPDAARGSDVSVIWDLMIHDIDLVHCLLGEDLQLVSCHTAPNSNDICDAAKAVLQAGTCEVSIEASRISDKRERRMKLVYDSGGEIEVDFLKRLITNTTRYALSSSSGGLLDDPLGIADGLFFQACRGAWNMLMQPHMAVQAVETAQKLHKLSHNLEQVQG